MGLKDVVSKLRASKAEEKRVPITIALKAKTASKIEDIAKGSGLSVSSIASEILEMGLSVSESVEVLGEQMQSFTEKVLTANETLSKAKKDEVRKAVKKKFPTGFSGKRKKKRG